MPGCFNYYSEDDDNFEKKITMVSTAGLAFGLLISSTAGVLTIAEHTDSELLIVGAAFLALISSGAFALFFAHSVTRPLCIKYVEKKLVSLQSHGITVYNEEFNRARITQEGYPLNQSLFFSAGEPRVVYMESKQKYLDWKPSSNPNETKGNFSADSVNFENSGARVFFINRFYHKIKTSSIGMVGTVGSVSSYVMPYYSGSEGRFAAFLAVLGAVYIIAAQAGMLVGGLTTFPKSSATPSRLTGDDLSDVALDVKPFSPAT